MIASSVIAYRMRKIRETRGWKQSAVADSMNITQQAYSFLEQGHGSPKFDTLTRFCDAMKVEMTFLLAYDAQITEESITSYGSMKFGVLIADYERLTHNVEFLKYLVKNTGQEALTDMIKPLISAAG